MTATLLLLLPLLAVRLVAQGDAAAPSAAAAPAPMPQDLAALAGRVDASHHPHGAVAPVTSFEGSLEVHLVAAAAERGGQADLLVKFLRWQRPDSTKMRDLIRYEVKQAGDPILRGRDRNGFWHLFQGEARDLGGAEFANDLAACERDTNLARQLLQFLDPAAVLRSLTKPSPVVEQPLQLGREPAVPCLRVEGDLAAFPLLQQAGADAPVRVAVYVTKDKGELLALEIWPLVDGVPERTRGELVRLRDLHERDGLLVPRRLEHFFRNEKGELSLQSRAAVTTLSLRPDLTAEDFDRPKK